MNVLVPIVVAAISQQGIWISESEIMQLPMSGSAWNNVFDDAQNSINANLGSPSSDGDTTAYAKALVYIRTGQESYRNDVIAGIEDVMGTEGGSVRYLGLGLLGYIIAADLVGLPSSLDATFRDYLAAVRFDDLGESRNLIEQHEQRPNNWGTTCGASRMALALYIGDSQDFDDAIEVFRGFLDGSWPHDYGDDCWREDVNPLQGINPVGSEWAGAIPDDQRRGGCPPNVPCENYVRSSMAGILAQALIAQRHSGFDSWGHEDQAVRRVFQFQVDHGCGWPGDDEWQPWLANWAYDSDFNTVSSPNHGKNMGYTDWTHGEPSGGGPFCGDGNVDPGEDCSTCPADVPCPPGTLCVGGSCMEEGKVTCDEHHDILWRHDDGETFIWLMDGTQRIGQGSPGIADPDDWEVAGVGDFDGDSHADILWRHTTTGQVYIWFVEGTQRVGYGSAGVVPIPLWEIVGIGNFDGDPQGRADILWRNTSNGQVYIWLMNGTQSIGQSSPGIANPDDWEVAGVGDFDGDSHADILWRHITSGQVYIWFIEGTQRVGHGSAGFVPIPLWEIVGTGNFDGDVLGRSDILWRSTSDGQVYIWLMNGTQRIGQGSLGPTGQAWQIVDTGDFNGDGYSDILWRNQSASGQAYTWFIKGTERVSHGTLGTVSHVWRISGTADFDGE